MSEHLQEEPTEKLSAREIPNVTWEYLSDSLHFTETPEMEHLRADLTAAMAENRDTVRDLAVAYQAQAEAIIDAQPDKKLKNAARVCANIAMALIRLEAGRVEDGVEDLELILDDLDGLIVGGLDEFRAVYMAVEQVLDEIG